MTASPKQSFLFLQGPLSAFYSEIADHLLKAGQKVVRVNFSGNDEWDWAHNDAINYRGTLEDWPNFLDQLITEQSITHILLHGDRRPYHKPAYDLAKKKGLHLTATELGYLRPDWMTLEPFACSTLSHFTSNAKILQEFAANQVPMPKDVLYPKVTSHSILHEIRFTTANLAMKWKYSAYQTHRSVPAYKTYSGWLFTQLANFWKQTIKGEKTLPALPKLDKDFYIFALQSEGDFQLRAHSPFPSRFEAMDYVLKSFANHAPKDSILVIKPHPLETLQKELYQQLDDLTQTYALSDRIKIVENIPITPLCENAKGFVTINSSAGFEAVGAGCPTCSVMPALYDMQGLTHQGIWTVFGARQLNPTSNCSKRCKNHWPIPFKCAAHSITMKGEKPLPKAARRS